MYAKHQYNVILVDHHKMEERDELVEWLGGIIEENLERFSDTLEVCVVRIHGQNLISSSTRGSGGHLKKIQQKTMKILQRNVG